jgi:hypothetical protein
MERDHPWVYIRDLATGTPNEINHCFCSSIIHQGNFVCAAIEGIFQLSQLPVSVNF